jgi:F5/8 type C domain
VRKERLSARTSGLAEADRKLGYGHFSRVLWLVVAVCASGLACSAYDNTTTPGHAVGEGDDGNDAPGGAGGGQAGAAAGGTLAQAGATTGIAGATGIAGSIAQAGAGIGGSGAGGSAGAGGAVAMGGSSGSVGSGGSASGAGGTGGTGNGMCSAHPLTATSKWTATASSSGGADLPAQAIDGDLTTRWSSGKDQAGDEWFQLDFGADATITKVTLKLGSNATDYPRSYKTRLTDTANNLSAPALLMGNGQNGVDTVMTFSAPTTGRYLLITQGGMVTGLWWSIAEISVECSG